MLRRRSPALCAPLTLVALALAPALSAACAPAGTGSDAERAQQVVYVPNRGDATITRIDTITGRAIPPPLPAGPAPIAVVPGPAGSVLILNADGPDGGQLTLVTRAGSRWVTRPLPLDPGARVSLLAGAGRYAAVVYTIPPLERVGSPAPCRLAVVDLASGGSYRSYASCAAGDVPMSLAVDNAGEGGPTVYLALWRPPADAPVAQGSGRILALSAATGRVRATRPLLGVPYQLVASPAPDQAGHSGRRLYCVEVSPGPDNPRFDRTDPAYTAEDRWRLLSLDSSTLNPDEIFPLSLPIRSLALSPGGDAGYALTSSALVRIDLATGSISRAASLADTGLGVAVTERHVYVANPHRSSVWALDRRAGGALRSIPTGRAPAGVFVP